MEKNYGTMDKTMVLRTKVLYNTYRTSIYEGKKDGRLPKNLETLIYNGKKLW